MEVVETAEALNAGLGAVSLSSVGYQQLCLVGKWTYRTSGQV